MSRYIIKTQGVEGIATHTFDDPFEAFKFIFSLKDIRVELYSVEHWPMTFNELKEEAFQHKRLNQDG